MVDYGITRGGTISGALTITGSAPTGNLLHVINTASAPSDHTVVIEGVNGSDRAVGLKVTGEVQDRHNMTIAGLHQWGNGAGGLDTNLYRNGANVLASDDSLSLIAAATTTDALMVRVSGDAEPQCVINGNGRLEFGGGATPVDVALFRDGSTRLHTINSFVTEGDLIIDVVGNGLSVKEGSNATAGSATLVGGTVTVSTTAVTASSRILLTSQADGGTPGFLRVSARTAATSFTITSSSGTDTSTVAWFIDEPA